MSFTAYLFAIIALLLAPGPTNTLVALAGARNGWRAVLPLIPAEALGYLTAILTVSALGAAILEQAPLAAALLKSLAALWVLFLAISLWRAPAAQGNGGAITGRRIYLTTLLNPKALVVGLVLIPAVKTSPMIVKLGAFMIAIGLIALVWSVAGSLTQTGANGRQRLRMIQRIASIWLAAVSLTLFAGAIRA